jgi:hypothetical protein
MGKSAEQRAANESRFREANEKLERKVVASDVYIYRRAPRCHG